MLPRHHFLEKINIPFKINALSTLRLRGMDFDSYKQQIIAFMNNSGLAKFFNRMIDRSSGDGGLHAD